MSTFDLANLPPPPRPGPTRRRKTLRPPSNPDTGWELGQRFRQFRALSDHPLFEQIHGMIVAGISPWHVAKWIHEAVPHTDPLGADNSTLNRLNVLLHRYRKFLPPALMLPEPYLDMLRRRVDLQIDVYTELSALYFGAKLRLGLYADQMEPKAQQDRPSIGEREQARLDMRLAVDILTKIHDVQVSSGMKPGVLPGTSIVMTQTNTNTYVGLDPLSQALEENPQDIPSFLRAYRALHEQPLDGASIVDGEARVVEGAE